MPLFSINNSDKKNTIVMQLINREREIANYEMNIEHYEALLTTLPQGEWPVLIAGYKGASIESVPVDLQTSVNDYSFRDRIKDVLSTERQELNKAIKMHEALCLQLPGEDIQALVNQALGR